MINFNTKNDIYYGDISLLFFSSGKPNRFIEFLLKYPLTHIYAQIGMYSSSSHMKDIASKCIGSVNAKSR